MRVIGIDLSLASTGLCVVGAGGIVSLNTIKTSKATGPKEKDSLIQRADRLDLIVATIEACIQKWDCELAVIEAPSYGSSFGSAHDRSGLWWMVVNMLNDHGIPIAQVSPQGRAKYGTGKGNSKKPDVYAAVKENYGGLVPRPLKNNDEADAVLLACMGARWVGTPVEPVRPAESILDSLTGVHWPVMAPSVRVS